MKEDWDTKATVKERRCEVCASSGLFWPDCASPGCPMLKEGYMVGGRKPPAWSLAGLLYRKRQMVQALRPFANSYHRNLKNMPANAVLVIRVKVEDLRYAHRLVSEDDDE